jgi:Kef-type K+ transport system membrane component KefB
MPWRQSAAVGFALNARGAMEMILATIAKDAGLIDDYLFVALIIMALITSILSGPILSRLTSSHLA